MLRAAPHPNQRLRIADIGTGSGAILLALLSELPDAYGVGTDISAAALQTAHGNAADLGLAERAGFVACDYAAALSGPFDLIVSNPPYVRSADIEGLATEVREHDPRAALDGGADGLDAYRALIPQAARCWRRGGALVVEVGQGQSGDVNDLMTAAGLMPERPARTDLAGIRRAWRGENCPHKARLGGQKNHLEYSPGATTFRSQHRSRVAGPVDPKGILRVEARVLKARARPGVKGSKTQGPLKRDSFRSCAASDRRANESLILRLKTHARNLCLFWQAE